MKRKPRTWTEWRLIWPHGEIDTSVFHSREHARLHIGPPGRMVVRVRVTEIIPKKRKGAK